MSKTIEIQIKKSRDLVEGLRRHVNEMGEYGVSNKEIDEMEKAIWNLETIKEVLDRIREGLTPTVTQLKVAMKRVKKDYTEKRKMIKYYYPQERWMDYGVTDIL